MYRTLLENYHISIFNKTGVRAEFNRPPPPAYLQLEIDTFYSIVMNPEKDALVAFTVPGCEDCMNMEPVLNLVAKNFELEPNVSRVLGLAIYTKC